MYTAPAECSLEAMPDMAGCLGWTASLSSHVVRGPIRLSIQTYCWRNIVVRTTAQLL